MYLQPSSVLEWEQGEASRPKCRVRGDRGCINQHGLGVSSNTDCGCINQHSLGPLDSGINFEPLGPQKQRCSSGEHSEEKEVHLHIYTSTQQHRQWGVLLFHNVCFLQFYFCLNTLGSTKLASCDRHTFRRFSVSLRRIRQHRAGTGSVRYNTSCLLLVVLVCPSDCTSCLYNCIGLRRSK